MKYSYINTPSMQYFMLVTSGRYSNVADNEVIHDDRLTGVGRNFSRVGGWGVILNANFKKRVLFALISSLTLYIGNV